MKFERAFLVGFNILARLFGVLCVIVAITPCSTKLDIVEHTASPVQFQCGCASRRGPWPVAHSPNAVQHTAAARANPQVIPRSTPTLQAPPRSLRHPPRHFAV